VRSRIRHGDLAGATSELDSVRLDDSPANEEWRWRFRNLRAELLVLHVKNKEALALLDEDPPAQFAASDIAIWRGIIQGAACYSLNRFEDSERYLQTAETLASTTNPGLLGEVRLRKGTLEFYRGDLTAADREYHSALVVARNQNDPFLEATLLGNLGLIATSMEHFDEAIEWDRSALNLSRSIGAQGSIAYILGNMGWCYREMGDYETALPLLRQADELSARAGSVSAQLDWEINIGNVYFERHDYEAAQREYERALAVAKKVEYETGITECFVNLAYVGLETGRLDSARRYRDEAADYFRTHPNHSLDLYFQVVAARVEEMRGNYAEAETSLMQVLNDRSARVSLRWEAESRLGEVLAAQGKRLEADRHFRRALETIAGARSAVKTEEFRLSFLSDAIRFYNEYIEFLLSRGDLETALQVAELSRAQTLAEGLGLSSKISFPLPNFQPRSIARRFNATLLFYWLGEKKSYLWAVTRTGVSLFTLPPSVEINPLVKAYQEALLGPRDVLDTYNPDGSRLYEILAAPAKKLIPAGSRVIILPDGSLYGLNFETLLVSSPQPHYWIDDVIAANANSLVLLAASNNDRAAKSRKLLLIGNPVSPSPSFPDLPQATSEMNGVERYFDAPDRTVLSREQATAAAYLHSDPGQFSFVHFVSHGTASRTSPLDSAVILSKDGDSFKLYARDIVTQPLHADLVTISACYGAGARTYSGEGLVGLSWAFLRAGAHGVIAALWEVNDNSTPELMNDLYAEITKGTAPDAALRHAKLKLLHSGTVYQKPFYWAPFELYRGH
jgi:CHAT domain-containing protein/Tfp pilus assembly protein PilF